MNARGSGADECRLATATRFARVRAAFFAAGMASACGEGEPPTSQQRDVGEFCVASNADGGLTFSVVVGYSDQCLSCGPRMVSCSATLTGTRVQLTSSLELRESSGVECLGYCLATIATCELGPVPPGEYDFAFADRSDTATLPIAGSVPLFEAPECDIQPHFLTPSSSW